MPPRSFAAPPPSPLHRPARFSLGLAFGLLVLWLAVIGGFFWALAAGLHPPVWLFRGLQLAILAVWVAHGVGVVRANRRPSSRPSAPPTRW